jgi:hypothetical protein
MNPIPSVHNTGYNNTFPLLFTARVHPQHMLVWHDIPEDKFQLTHRSDDENSTCRQILKRSSTCSAYMFGEGYNSTFKLSGPYCLGQLIVVQDGEVRMQAIHYKLHTGNRHVESDMSIVRNCKY